MSNDKFNTKLSCKSHPFGYVEQRTEIETKFGGTMAVISFGALEVHSHYAPEFGGVAIVHVNPDIYIAVRYIPWSIANRKKEHERCVDYLTKSIEKTPVEFAEHFLHNEKYSIPANKKRWHREYLEAREKYIQIENAKKLAGNITKIEDRDPRFFNGEELIDLD